MILDKNTIYYMNSFDLMKSMNNNSVDIIITDPPYDLEIDQKSYTGVYKTKGNHLDKIKIRFGNRFNPIKFLDEGMRISKNGIIAWLSKNLLKVYIDYAESNGYKWNLEFWHKTNPIPAHHNHKLNDTEFSIRIYSKGSYFNNELNYNDYFTYYIENVQNNNGHPTPKPLNIMIKQIKVFSKEKDLIFDPFAGSGTTLLAAIKLNRNYIGCEIIKDFYDIAQKRIKSELDQYNLI